MARPRREFDVAQLLQLAPPDGLIERDRKFVMEPLDQIDQSPAHNLKDRWDRAAFDNLHQSPPLGIIEPGPGAGCLAIQKAIWATGIEPYHAVPHDLQSYSADPRRRSPTAAIVNLSQRQQPPRLVRAFRRTRQSPHHRSTKVIPQADR